MNKQKLELTWIGKDNRPRLEPCILLEEQEKSYYAWHRVTDHDIFDNRLIFGDNLLALKALEQEFVGKIKCIYIDPPYNTGSAFEHYDDGIEHSPWLSLMRDRLELLRRLFREDGLLFVQIDDNEQAYLRILLDEVFGRKNFVSTIVWQKKYAGKPDSKFFTEFHEYIICFAKESDKAQMNGMPRTEEQDSRYKNLDNDLRGVWASDNLLRSESRDYAIYPIKTPAGKEYWPPKGSSWRFTKEKYAELVADNRIWFGENGGNMPRLKRFLKEVATSLPPTTWWTHQDVGHTGEAKKEILALFPDAAEVFATPKPERLMQRIIQLATNPDD
jgi:adenine-specific DNA-methyltransferase